MLINRSDDSYDNPRISLEEDCTDDVRLFCHLLAQRFPCDEADSFVP
jgi:hypothetical protein